VPAGEGIPRQGLIEPLQSLTTNTKGVRMEGRKTAADYPQELLDFFVDLKIVVL
jgi:hypothetical protein